MDLKRFTRTVSLVAAVLGLFITGFLTRAHYTGTLRSLCDPGSGCWDVLTGAYSHFLGMPTASYGLIYFFTVLLLLLLFPYVKDEGRQFFFTLGLALHSVALFVSLFLTAYNLLALSVICQYCLAATTLVLVLFGITLYWKVTDVNLEILEEQSGEVWKGATVVLLLLLIMLGGLYYRELTTPDPDQAINEVRTLNADFKSLGDPGAPVRVIEFYDLACPFCRTFTLETFPKIREQFIETGKVVWNFRAFPDPVGHKHSLYAHAFLARVADGSFLDARNQIMRESSRWVARENENPRPYFDRLAKQYNLPGAENTSREIRHKLLRNRKYFEEEFGLEGTPSYMVNGKIYTGRLNFKVWRNIINRILGNKATKSLSD